MKLYGLIGKKLSHSFSKKYFGKKFSDLKLSDVRYENFELEEINALPALIQQHPDLLGLNVTNPYKVEVIPYLSELSEEAQKIGAVNCIKISEGKLIGYNTDVYGFAQSIKPFLDKNHNRALILGMGGAAKAVAYALESLGVEVFYASRTRSGPKVFSYHDLNDFLFEGVKLIINTTPLGLWPDVHKCPRLPYQFLTPQHLCFDLIYNPEETLFLEACRKHGAMTVNGYSMLQLQAEKSWEIWNYGK